MAWARHSSGSAPSIRDIRRVGNWTSFCRKCSCHHPLETVVTGPLKGCICNVAGRRGACGVYVPTDSLEFLEYMSILKEEGKI